MTGKLHASRQLCPDNSFWQLCTDDSFWAEWLLLAEVETRAEHRCGCGHVIVSAGDEHASPPIQEPCYRRQFHLQVPVRKLQIGCCEQVAVKYTEPSGNAAGSCPMHDVAQRLFRPMAVSSYDSKIITAGSTEICNGGARWLHHSTAR